MPNVFEYFNDIWSLVTLLLHLSSPPQLQLIKISIVIYHMENRLLFAQIFLTLKY